MPERRLPKRKKSLIEQIQRETKEVPKRKKKLPHPERVVSTGSTLLDLSIYGTRVRGGGVPGGIVMEVFGPPSAGKTAILVELATSAQLKGGDIRFDDPEARLDREYARLYGLRLPSDKYTRSDTVNEMFTELWEWQPAPRKQDSINVSCEDSLAALSTELEMGQEDKMGMKRAKEFSAGLRKTARMIKKNNWLIACTNQERGGPDGTTTPGGKGIPYYASLRIRVALDFRGSKIYKLRTVGNKKIEQLIGIKSICEIKKSSIDNPFRTAPIHIIFGVGIDDVRGNLQWYKEMTDSKKYHCIDRDWAVMDKAIKHIEENNLEGELRTKVIDLWDEIQEQFKPDRKRKVRF